MREQQCPQRQGWVQEPLDNPELEFQKQPGCCISEMAVKGWVMALNPSEGAL